MGLGIAVGITAIILASWWLYEELDIDTKLKLQTLEPHVRKKVEKLLLKAKKKGIQLKIMSAYRDCEEQNGLYAQGRTKPGKIVTNAKCGQSDHNMAVAVDVVPVIDGKPTWDVPEATWLQIGELGESVGLKWGGRWKSFKDRPHFYDRQGKTLAQLHRDFQAKQVA